MRGEIAEREALFQDSQIFICKLAQATQRARHLHCGGIRQWMFTLALK